ncbi:MAG: hypothetical protein R2792_03875 [Saprospiraceae bacterium]
MRKITFALFILVAFAACKQQKEPIASYVYVEPFIIDAGGDASDHKIVDCWFYAGGEFLGAYTLPALIPVIAEGPTELQIFPGVKENGIAATPNIYPFLNRSIIQADLTPMGTDTVHPSTTYAANAIFPFGLDRGSFDGGATITLENRDADQATGFVLTETGGYEGKSLYMAVDTTHPIMYVATEYVSLPTTFQQEVWLELHYRNDMPFSLWLVGNNNNSEITLPIFQFNPTEDGAFNKIYINLTEALVSLYEASQFKLELRASLPSDLNGGYEQDAGKVWVDNIRLVHL